MVALAQRTLADFEHLQSADRLTAISDHVARRLGVSYERLSSKSRTQHLAYCRQVAMYVCRSLAGASYTALGIHFQRNHSTAYWAVRLVTIRMARDAGFRRAIEKIERELTSTTATVAAIAAVAATACLTFNRVRAMRRSLRVGGRFRSPTSTASS